MSDYPNSGTIGRNTYKQEGSKQPDLRGSCDIVCPHCLEEQKFQIAAWTRVASSGRKFIALKFQTLEQAEAARAARRRGPEPSTAAANSDESSGYSSEQQPTTTQEDNVPF